MDRAFTVNSLLVSKVLGSQRLFSVWTALLSTLSNNANAHFFAIPAVHNYNIRTFITLTLILPKHFRRMKD